MRICFLADGSSFHTQRWVDYFTQKGHQCYLLSLEQGIKTKAVHYVLKSHCLVNALKFILVVPRVKKILENVAPDILNAHFASAYGFTGALTGFKPLVVSCWGSDILVSPKKSFLHKLRVKYVLKRAGLLTSDGEDLKDVIEKLGVETEKVVISPMGIGPEILEKRKKKEPFKKNFTILSARKLDPLYDTETLLLAAKKVVENYKDKVKFVITGEGSQKEKLLKFAQKLGIGKFLDFKGFLPRDKFLECFKKADLYISTSLSDSTSVALLEAMALGLAPIVTDIPGNREWIEEGENGFLFPPGDHKTLAEKIIFVVENLNTLDTIRDKNLSAIKKRALWQDNMTKIEERFLELTTG